MVRNSVALISTGIISVMWGKHTREIDGSVVIGVDLVDHVSKLSLRWVLAQTPHDGTQLLGGDLS